MRFGQDTFCHAPLLIVEFLRGRPGVECQEVGNMSQKINAVPSGIDTFV